jgi:hypothetical protein
VLVCMSYVGSGRSLIGVDMFADGGAARGVELEVILWEVPGKAHPKEAWDAFQYLAWLLTGGFRAGCEL